MTDQRVKMRPALGLKNRRHSFRVGGISAQAVNRLGAKGDQFTGRQQSRGLCDITVSTVENFSHVIGHASLRL